MQFPAAIPEIPVHNVEEAAAYYVSKLGFTFDWGDDEGGIGGISRGDSRIFLTNAPFRAGHGNAGSVVIWINLNSKAEVAALHAEWQAAGAKIVSEPEDKPWKLHEFLVADLDGNQIRVFYDFGAEVTLRHASTSSPHGS